MNAKINPLVANLLGFVNYKNNNLCKLKCDSRSKNLITFYFYSESKIKFDLIYLKNKLLNNKKFLMANDVDIWNVKEILMHLIKNCGFR